MATELIPDFLKSADAQEIYQEIRLKGQYSDAFSKDLAADDRAFLTAELYVRTSRYHEIANVIPQDASPWCKRLAVCTGYLFTSPALALNELDYLELECPVESLKIRFKAWRMHLHFLLGHERQGLFWREEVEKAIEQSSVWQVEILTLLAISYFSSGNAKRSIDSHLQALSEIERMPDRYFQSFGAAMGARSALKVCDAKSFEIFSRKLEDSLAQAFDSRYKLRQLGYRAMILTQLGEMELAKRYWTEGDALLKKVDQGASTVERSQYLIFRCLAAALLGDLSLVSAAYDEAITELNSCRVHEIHLAELEVCRVLAPVANPILRAQNIGRSFRQLEEAKSFFSAMSLKTVNESVKIYYEEAHEFCDVILSGRVKRPTAGEGDPWRTLTISIISNYQNFLNFAERIDYFRLIPNFVHELGQKPLTDQVIAAALEKVIKIAPTLAHGRFELSFERQELSKVSQVEILLTFANSLRDLYRKAEENARGRIISETVEMTVHDFRRPFNLMTMALENLANAQDLNSLRRIAERILPDVIAAAENANRMLDDVEDASRPMRLEKEVVRPKDIVASAIAAIKGTVKKLKCSTDFKTDLPIKVDHHKMMRAIANIVENAAQATPSGELWIRTKLEEFHEKDATVITIGNRSYIHPEDLGKIFEKFYSKGKENGTGLGLYITKKIMDAHGGEVRCRSSIDGGTEFDLIVPCGP